MTKIFYVSNNQLPTIKAHGIQIMKTCEALTELGIDIELIIPDRGIYPEITELDPLKYYGIKHAFKVTKLSSHDFGTRGSKLLFWLQQYLFARTVRFYIKNPAIVYSRDSFITYVLSGRGHTLFWEAHNFPRNIKNNFYQTILKNIKGLIVISEGLKKSFLEIGFPKQKIITVPDGFDPAEFNIPENKEEARRNLGLPQDKKIIIYAGHLFEWKGAGTLVEAAQKLTPDIQVVVVGGTVEDINRLKSMDTLNKIRFEGFKKHDLIPLYLRAADVAVLPNKKDDGISEHYTSPLKMFEYIASGLPIIASNLPSIREILNGPSVVLIEPNNSQALVLAIESLISDPIKMNQLASLAHQNSIQYSWLTRARKIKSFISL